METIINIQLLFIGMRIRHLCNTCMFLGYNTLNGDLRFYYFGVFQKLFFLVFQQEVFDWKPIMLGNVGKDKICRLRHRFLLIKISLEVWKPCPLMTRLFISDMKMSCHIHDNISYFFLSRKSPNVTITLPLHTSAGEYE